MTFQTRKKYQEIDYSGQKRESCVVPPSAVALESLIQLFNVDVV